MAIPTYNFPNHVKGDTFIARQISFSSVTHNAPIDLTNAEIKIDFKENADSEPAYFWSTSDNSIIITDGPNGIVTMTAKVIDALASTYIYDIQVNNNGIIKTYFTGSMKIIQDISY